jgi:hypothetical protein
VVAGNLGKQLIGSNSDGGSKLPLRYNPRLQPLCRRPGLEQRGISIFLLAKARQIEVGLVNGHRLGHRPGYSDELHGLPRFFLVSLHARPDKDAFRAEAARPGAGRSRARRICGVRS